MASIPYFQGAQAEIELRVRIGILEAELKLANDHKQAADLVIIEFAKIFTQNNAQSYRNRSTAEDVAILKGKLATANTEVLTLKAQLSQSNALLYSLLPHLNKSVASSVTEPPSPKITPAVTTTTVKVNTEDLTTLRDDESDDGMESPSDPKEHHSSLSSSFSNNSDGYKHIARFVKSRKEEKQREETKPKEEIPGVRRNQSTQRAMTDKSIEYRFAFEKCRRRTQSLGSNAVQSHWRECHPRAAVFRATAGNQDARNDSAWAQSFTDQR